MTSMWTDGHSGLTSDSSSHGFPNTNNSLIRALESEQEAHEVTKSHLDHESSARREAEAETQRLAEHNKSLLNSIKLLQSTVKHMVQQQENKPVDEQSPDEVKNALKEFKKEAEHTKIANSILYDVLANYKVPHTTVSNGEESTSIIDLDLLNTPDPNDHSEKVQLQRTLRRQIGLSSESACQEKQSPNTEYQEKIQAIAKADTPANTGNAAKIADKNSVEVDTDGISSIVQAPSNQASTTIESLFPDLPSTFLAKYGKHSAKSADNSDDAGPLITPKKNALTAALPIRSREGSKDSKPLSKIVDMPDLIALKWRVDGRHADELRGARSQTKTDNYFREHPIRFGKHLSPEVVP